MERPWSSNEKYPVVTFQERRFWFSYNDFVCCEKQVIIRKDIFACLFSIHDTISLSCHEQVCLSGLRFERYFSHHQAT